MYNFSSSSIVQNYNGSADNDGLLIHKLQKTFHLVLWCIHTVSSVSCVAFIFQVSSQGIVQ